MDIETKDHKINSIQNVISGGSGKVILKKSEISQPQFDTEQGRLDGERDAINEDIFRFRNSRQ